MKKILFILLTICSIKLNASHLAGAELFYKSLGGNQFLITLNIFRDCSGISQTSASISFVSGCGQSFVLPGVQVGTAVNVSQICPAQINNTTCNGGNLPGMEMYTYTVVATLPPCATWEMSWTDGSRNNSNNSTNSSSSNFYVSAFLNNIVAPLNNSPVFNAPPQPYYCVNQAACLNLATYESNGNSLSYSLVAALSTPATALTYSAPFTAGTPIVGITVNAVTGEINFNSALTGNFIVVVKCEERDINNVLIGSVIRDFQVVIVNCNNQSITCNQGNILNVTSGSVPTGLANSLQICENIPFCFDVFFTDPDVADSIKITSPNLFTSLVGATMVTTYTAGIKNACKTTICWTPAAGSSGLNTNFSLVVKDNACPVPSQQTINYIIDVLPATTAGPDRTICGPQSASITATGSSTVFTWSDLAGNPIATGPAFSCNPCHNPVIKPAVTSTYVVTNVGGGANCKNKDTLIVFVVPDFTLNAGVSIASGCLNSLVQFTSNVAPAGSYTYSWSPAAPLTSTNTANTSATYASPGTYNYTLVATSNLGCTKQQTNISFIANPVVSPQFTVVPTNTTICSNTNVPLTVNLGAAPPTTCGLALTGCVAANVVTIGNGTSVTSGTTAYPNPYTNFYDSQHMQILYTSAELLAAGIVPGKINSLAFNVSALNGLVNSLSNVSIKLKCTSATSATTFDMAGLNQVFFIANYNVTTGWNSHSFNQSYEWLAGSNLLVDFCYDDNTLQYTQNANSPFTITPFTSVVWYRADATNTCPLTTVSGTSSNRPNIRFGNCSSTPPANAFTFSWLPTTGLSNAAIQSPTTNISSSIVYTVVVTPTAAVTCSNVGTTSLTVTSPTQPTITPVSAKCTNATSLNLVANPTGGTYSLSAATTTAGVFTPALATVGNNTVTYSYGGVGCTQTTSIIIPIERFVPSTIIGTIAPLCANNPTVNLATALVTSTLGIGVWAGNGVLGTAFSPTIAGAGTHTLTYSTNSMPTATLCPSTSSLVVSVSGVIQPTITPAGPYCDNFAAQTMMASPTGGTWTSTNVATAISGAGILSPVSSNLGANYLLYTIGNGPCTFTTSTIVNIEHFIPATITGALGPFCDYATLVNLQAAAQYTGGVWSGNGVTGSDFSPSIAGAGLQTITYSTTSLPTTTLCPDSKTLAIQVNAKPEANFLSNKYQDCNPLIVNFSSTTYATGSVTWNFGDGSPVDTGFIATHTYSVPGTYSASVMYTDPIGCKDTTKAINTFTVFANPIASFVPSLLETTVVDGQIDFTNTSTILNYNTYSWNIGGLTTSIQTNAQHLFTNSGSYVITLTATSPDNAPNNCVDDTSIIVVVKPDVVLYVPNAFTPGSDGLNDDFRIFLPQTGVDYSTFSLLIYDRWGELVYKTNDINASWTGAKNNAGPILKQDVYVWKIEFQDELRKNYQKMGHVSLLSKSKQ